MLMQEGALPSLVEMINAPEGAPSPRTSTASTPSTQPPTAQGAVADKEDEEEVATASQMRAHATRLLAMLCQAPPTHELMIRQGGVSALSHLLKVWREQRQPLFPYDQARYPGEAYLPSATSIPGSSGSFGMAWTSTMPGAPSGVGAAARGGLAASAALSGARKEALSEDEFRELAAARHAASALSSMFQNLDLHFELVGLGLVPLLVQLLHAGEGWRWCTPGRGCRR